MPTPSPTMAPSTGAQLGMSMTLAMSDMELTPTASPSTAVPSGRAVAIRDPKATKRMSAATRSPMSSPTAGCGCSNA